MDTLREALFKAMLNESWFTDSAGDVKSPTGYFGYVVNDLNDWHEVHANFPEVVALYADVEISDEWLDQNFYGVWSAMINSDGIIHIHKHGDYVRTPGVAVLELTQPVRHAMQTFSNRLDEYREWLGEN